jgi:cytochrome c-type biogenesis protein CcmH
MVSFSFIAGVLVGAVAGPLAIALWRRAGLSGRLSPVGASVAGRLRLVIAGGLVVSFAVAAGIIYLAVGTHHSPAVGRSADASASSTATARSMETEVAALEARLARGGGSAGDWNLLAQAYDFLGRPEDARRARERAGGAAPGPVSEMSVAALTAAAAAAEGASASAANMTGADGAQGPATPSQTELEQRVARSPRDAQAWLALAEARRARRDFAGAREAYVKVADLKAMSAQAWADYADVLGSLAGGSLSGEAAHAIDSALALDPQNPKALWLKASEQYQQRNFAAALTWWKKLRALLPADSPDARIIDGNIAESAALAGGAPAAPASGVPGPASANVGAEVSGTVALDGRFADRVPPDSTLFIYARAVDSPGPPLAVLRTTAHSWPVTFRLDDSMAMIPSRRLSQFNKVVVEARISRSGQAAPAAGDLYVTSPQLQPAPGTRIALVINREIG